MIGQTPPNSGRSGSELGQLTAVDLVAIAWRRRLLLLVCSLFSIGLGILYVSFAEPTFEVESRLLVQQKSVLGDPARDLSKRDDEFMMTQAQIVSSPMVLNAALAVQELADTDDSSVLLRRIVSNFSANPVPGANVIKISYSGKSEREAIGTVDAIVDSYRRYVREMQRATYRETLNLLTDNDQKLRQEIVELEEEYERLREESSIVGHGRDSASIQRSLLADLGATIIQVRNRRIELANQLNIMLGTGEPVATSTKQLDGSSSLSPTGGTHAILVSTGNQSGIGTVDDILGDRSRAAEFATQAEGILQELGSEIRDIRRELRQAVAADIGLAQKFEQVHPDRIALREQIASLEKSLEDHLNQAPGILRRELDAVQKQEAQLVALYEEDFEKAKEADLNEIQQQQALGRIQRVQGIHDSILTQLRQFELADSAMAGGDSGIHVSVLQEPVLIRSGISPSPILLLAVCGLFGMTGGFALASLLENSQRRSPITSTYKEASYATAY